MHRSNGNGHSRVPRSRCGVAALTVALLLIAAIGNHVAPVASVFARQDDGTNPACDVASPESSPHSSDATPSDATAVASPAVDPCAEAPTGEELLATAAALLEAATAEAAAAGEVVSAESAEITEALPAADLPSTNVQGFSFNLESSLTADLSTVTTEAPIYQLQIPDSTVESAAALAAALGVTGAVEDRGNATFTASGNGELFVTPSLIQYLSPAQPAEGELPDDNSAIEVARAWLRASTLIQPDLGPGSVVSRDEGSGRVVVVFTPVEPTTLLSAYPSITVSVGRGGAVLEVASRWASILRSDLYQLRPAEEAWRQVESGQGYVEVDLAGSGIQEGTVVSGLVSYGSIELAYTTAGPPGAGQYLVPIFIFNGQVTPEGLNQGFPIQTYVTALAISDTPVG